MLWQGILIFLWEAGLVFEITPLQSYWHPVNKCPKSDRHRDSVQKRVDMFARYWVDIHFLMELSEQAWYETLGAILQLTISRFREYIGWGPTREAEPIKEMTDR